MLTILSICGDPTLSIGVILYVKKPLSFQTRSVHSQRHVWAVSEHHEDGSLRTDYGKDYFQV